MNHPHPHDPPDFPDAALIERLLREALAPSELRVVDDSHLHAGHAGAREGRHFTVHLRAQAFEGLSRPARHRLVYHALRHQMARGIHALAIHAKAPAE